MKDQNERMLDRSWQKPVSKEKESDCNVDSASSKKEVVSIAGNSKKNVVFELDIEDKPNIDFSNTPKVSNDEEEPGWCSKISISISNVVDRRPQASNDKSLCSKLFTKKNYFENFCDEYLEFKYYVQSELDSETQ